MAEIRKLTDNVSVAPQLQPGDAAAVKEQGFRSVLCNRPDYEAGDQPTYRNVASAIDAQGIVTEFQPVSNREITDDDVDNFADHLNDLDGPVLAYCLSLIHI